MFSRPKTLAIGLAAGAFIFTACGKQTEEVAVAAEPAAPVKPAYPEAPDAAIQQVITEFAKGNGGIIWEAMPASYQGDVTKLAHLAGTKIDPEVYDKSFAAIARLAEVADKQKAFIVNSSFLQGGSAEELADVEAALPSVIGLVKTIATCDLASSTGLQNFDGQAFFDTTVSKFAQYSEALAQLAGEESTLSDYLNAEVSVVTADELQATLSAVVPGQEPVEQTFTKVEERWVPADMASQWAAEMAEATANLEAMSPDQVNAQKPQILGVLTMIDGVLTQIEAAQTQEQFEQSLQGAMMPIMGIMMMWQGMGGGMQAPGPTGLPANPSVAPSSSMPSVK